MRLPYWKTRDQMACKKARWRARLITYRAISSIKEQHILSPSHRKSKDRVRRIIYSQSVKTVISYNHYNVHLHVPEYLVLPTARNFTVTLLEFRAHLRLLESKMRCTTRTISPNEKKWYIHFSNRRKLKGRKRILNSQQ